MERLDRGPSIRTYSGRRFYLLDPRPEDILIEDIAHALSMVCRFTGHVERFYSVADHCVRVSRLLMERSLPVHLQLIGLLHDATEAYVGDMIHPLKGLLPDYSVIEDRILEVILRKYGLPILYIPPVIAHIDRELCWYEMRDLIHGGPFEPGSFIPMHEELTGRIWEPLEYPEIVPWPQREAEDMYLGTFDVLMRAMNK